MTTKLLRARYGQPTTTALATAIADAKGGDPLAPVTVVVPDHALGLMLRRRLAASSPTGLAAVDFVTLLDLARTLSAGSSLLADRRPVSDAVVLAATRRLLAERPGAFGAVADHPSVERALVAAHRSLREVTPEALDRLADQSDVLAEVVTLHRVLVKRLGERFHDERERADVAAAVLTDASTDIPPVILHLPGDLTASESQLLSALANATSVAAIVGDADTADHSVSPDPHLEKLADALGIETPDPGPAGTRSPRRVASVPDQEEAVRHAIRRIVEAAHDGTPLDRIAIIHPSTTDDARLVHERLASGGIGYHAGGVRRLDETIAGRFLVGLLGLNDRDLRRTDVDAWMADVPLWDPEYGVVPARAWSRIAARAEVVSGIDDWTSRLDRLAAELETEAETDEEDRPWVKARLSTEASRARQLAEFIERLDRSLNDLADDSTWADRCQRVRRMIRQHLGSESVRSDWPPEETRALDEIGGILDNLAELDQIEPQPPQQSFRRALAAELQRPLGRAGRTGIGVQVVGINQAIGLDADLVIVVGLTEGSIPTRAPSDPILSDAHRSAARTGLPTRHDHAARQHHAFLAAVTAAAQTIVLIHTRGDLSRSGDRPISRYLLAEFEALAGHRPEPDELQRFTADWFDHVASFTDALDRDEPATAQEYDLASAVRGGRSAVDTLREDDPVTDRGIEAHEARAGASFTRFDGNLSGVDLPLLDGELSASRLEKWVRCPFSFFSEYVLGVHPFEEPTERTDLAPAVRGSIIHRVLDRLVSEGLEADTLPAPGAPWTTGDRTRAVDLLKEEFDHAGARGEAPHPRFRSTVHARLAADLDDFLVIDSDFRASLTSSPIAAEKRFGGDNALIVTLTDGRPLRFRGAIDRVDVTADGDLVVVDAKTGKPESFKKIPGAHFPGGDHLQLPIYALAAADDERSTRHATYAFFGEVADSHRHLGYDIDVDVLASFERVLASIVHGIDAGSFPHHPPDSDRPETFRCPHCSPDGLDARRVRTARARKVDHPALALHEDHITTDFLASGSPAADAGTHDGETHDEGTGR